MNKKSINVLWLATFIFILMTAFYSSFCEASGEASVKISTAGHYGTENEKHRSEGGGHYGDPYAEVFKESGYKRIAKKEKYLFHLGSNKK